MNTAKANGLQLTLFVGGNLEIGNVSGKTDSVRAYISGKKVFVRADHPTYTADQLMRHETGHARIARGEIDPEDVKNRIAQTYGDEHVGHLSDLYAAAYEGSGLTADEIWEEVICDSLGDMNIFQDIEAIADDAGVLLNEVKESAEAETKTARGPPAADTNVPGKMSRDNGRRAQRGRSIEMETMENNRFQRLRQFKGDLPAEWYAFTGDYFYIYSNQSYTDYTLLAKVKITEKNRPHINEFKERIDNGTYKGAEAFDRWTEDFRRGKGRDSWHHVGTGKTGAAGRNDGVDVRKQRGKHSGNSAEGSGAGEVKSKFSMETPVEQTKTLIALHNMDEEKLRRTLKLGSWPAPSVAIVKANQGHENFGEYSAVFPRSTIDPEADYRNKVYGSDAWTPTHNNAQVEYEVNYDAKRAFEDKIERLSSKFAGGAFRNGSVIGSTGVDNETSLSLDEIAQKLSKYPAVQAAYLQNRGDTLEPVYKKKNFDSFGNEALQSYINSIGYQELARLDMELTLGNELPADVMEAARDIIMDEWVSKNEWRLKNKPELREKRIENQRKKLEDWRVRSFIQHAWEYYEEYGATTNEIDTSATAAAMFDMILPDGAWGEVEKVVQDWVRPQLEGVLGEPGIYNGRDRITNNGRRSFRETHYPYSAENIVRAMFNQGSARGEGLWGANAEGMVSVATPDYDSVTEIHADEGRLRTASEDEYDTVMRRLDSEIGGFIAKSMEAMEAHSSNRYEEGDIIGHVLLQAAGSHTVKDVQRVFKREGYDLPSNLAKDALKIFRMAAETPTKYFEAKPQRVVGFEEALAVVAPTDAPADLVDAMRSAGMNVLTYETGNNADRLEKVNSLEDAKFSRELDSLEELRKQNLELQKQVEYWKGQTKVTTRETATLRQGDIDKLARRIVNDYSSTMKAGDIAGPLKDLGEYILRDGDGQNELTWPAVKEKAVNIARDVVQSAEVLQDEAWQQYSDLRQYLKTTDIVFGKEYQSEIADYNDFRKRNFGRLKLVKGDGTNVDRIYKELAEQWPWLFNEEAVSHPADQLLQIEDVLESLKPIYENPFSYHMAEATEYLANEIIDSLLGESIRQSPKTFADKQAAKQDKLRGDAAQAVAAAKQETKDAKQALKAAKQDAAQAIKEARQEAFLAGQMRQGQKMAEVMRKEAVARDKKLADLKKHYAEAADRKKARAADSKARTRLLNIAKRLQNKKLPAVTRDLLNQYIGELDTVAKSITSTSLEKLYDLRDWYDDQKANNPDFIADPRIEKTLQRLSKRQIKNLSAKEVADLTEALLGIENQIRTQDKLINSEEKRRIYGMGLQVIADVENTRGSKTGVLGIPSKYIVTETLSPIRMIRRMTGYVDNDPLYTVANELADGQRKQMDFQRRAGDLFKKWVNDKKFSQSIAGEKAQLVKITGFGKDGKEKTVHITPAMRMSLYLHSLNSQNMRHVTDGGVTIPDMKLYKKGKIAEAYARGTTIRLTPSMVRGITQGMTAQELAFAQTVSRYFNGMSQTEINEVSEQLKGYSLAQVENYFPINTDSSFTRKDFEALKFDGTIEGMGFLKERVNSSLPIMLRDMNSVLTQSIDMTSKYVGLAIPVRNFNKVWGVTKASYDDSGNRTGYESSVQQSVKQKWGEDAYRYIENMMTDLNTGRPAKDVWAKALNKIKGNYAGAVLTLNPGVALKQYGAWFSAGSTLGFKSLVKALGPGKVDVNLIHKYTPLLWYRSQGFSTQELGDMAKNDMRLPKWLDWLSGTDVQITTRLWKAAEHYVRTNNKDLKFGTDAFYRTVAEVYNRTIEETQPNYTTMQRPQLLRSENTLMQNLSMFKTDAFQSFNVLYDAMGNLHAKKNAAINSKTQEAQEAYRQAKINAGRAVSAQFMQLAVVAGVQVVWNLIRGKREKYEDEEDKITFGSVAAEVGKDMLGGVASFVPFGSDIWELVNSKLFDETYYGMDAVTVQALTDAVKSISGLTELFSGTAKSLATGEAVDWNETRLAADNYFDDFSKALGIPYENVANAFNAAYLNGAKWMKGRYLGTYAAMQLTTGYESGTGDYYDLLWKTLKAGDMDAYQTISKDLQEHIEQYDMSGESITSAMRSRYNKAVKENPDFKLTQRAADIIGVRGKYAADEADDSFGADDLGAEAYQKYINEQADTYRSVADQIQGYDSFAGMDAEVKDKLLAAADKLAKQTALENAADGEFAVDTKWIDWARNGDAAGVDEAEAILFKVAYDMAVSDHDKDGKVISGSKKENTLEQAKEWIPGLTKRELDYLMSNYWSNKK